MEQQRNQPGQRWHLTLVNQDGDGTLMLRSDSPGLLRSPFHALDLLCCRAEVKRKADVAAAKVQEAKEREVEAMKMQQAMDDMGRILAVDLDSAEQVTSNTATDRQLDYHLCTPHTALIARLSMLWHATGTTFDWTE